MRLPASAYTVIHLTEQEYITALVICASSWRGNTVHDSYYSNPSSRTFTLAVYLSTRPVRGFPTLEEMSK